MTSFFFIGQGLPLRLCMSFFFSSTASFSFSSSSGDRDSGLTSLSPWSFSALSSFSTSLVSCSELGHRKSLCLKASLFFVCDNKDLLSYRVDEYVRFTLFQLLSCVFSSSLPVFSLVLFVSLHYPLLFWHLRVSFFPWQFFPQFLPPQFFLFFCF